MSENLAYQEERREELIGGKVVMMSPASASHTYVADNILIIFKQYLKGKKCIPFGDGLLVHLTDKDKFVPDVMVVCDYYDFPMKLYADLVAEAAKRNISLRELESGLNRLPRQGLARVFRSQNGAIHGVIPTPVFTNLFS